MKFVCEVKGNPQAQGRPRFFARKKKDGTAFVGCYDPETSKSWKETVKWQAISRGPKIMEGALTMELIFTLQRPKTLPKKVIDHIKKPDLDNLAKAVKDALKGICYRDDSQFVKLLVEKKYGDPGVIIHIQSVEELRGYAETSVLVQSKIF